jgi:hypothetical protein
VEFAFIGLLVLSGINALGESSTFRGVHMHKGAGAINTYDVELTPYLVGALTSTPLLAYNVVRALGEARI